MQDLILVINTGSSSLKFSVFKKNETKELFCLLEGEVDGIGKHASIRVKSFPEGITTNRDEISIENHGEAIKRISELILLEHPEATWSAIGHRIVHGGLKFVNPLLLDDKALVDLRELIPFDPLHQPIAILAIESCLSIFKNVPQIACFDTAFHSTQSQIATAIALPQFFTDKGIRRYGFHGISYQYISSMLSKIDPTLASGRTIVAHLGNGASLCALHDGKSIATTMGFSVLDGLMMGSRCGSIDPGAILYLLNTLKVKPTELEDILYNKSGLLGVSGISNDVRTLLASTDPKAKKAIALYVYRIVREVGSLASALGGLDGFIFTGGVGENSAEIRQLVIEQLAWLGFEIDKTLNQINDSKISTLDSIHPVYVIHTNENRMIALQVVAQMHL